MIILGSNSDIAQAFVERALQEKEKFKTLYLLSSNPELTEKFAKHIEVKYFQHSEVIPFDISQPVNYTQLESIESDLLFCATGYLGKDTEALYDTENTEKIIDINYAKLVPVLNFFAQKMETKRNGSMIVLSSVAGERGRQSNFIYGSAKAGITAYLSGLRNYMSTRKVHVMTVKPGFMDTKMTEGLPLNPSLTATPHQAAKIIFKAWKRNRNVIYVLPIWAIIMLVIRNIPELLFKRMKL